MRRCFTDPHYWKNPALRRSREKLQPQVDYSQLHTELLTSSHSKLSLVQSSKFKLVHHSPETFHKSKVHRTQLSLKNSVGFWKLHSRFFEFINTFYAYDSTCIQMSTFLNYFKCTHAFKRSQFRLIPNACKRSQNNLELFSVIKTCPKSAPGFASVHKYSWLP